MRFEVFMTMKI